MSGGWQQQPQQPGQHGGGYGQPGQYPQQPGYPAGQQGVPHQQGYTPQHPGYPPRGGYGPPGQPYGPQGPQRGGNRSVLWIAVVLVLIAAGVGGFLFLKKDDDSKDTAKSGSQSSGAPVAPGASGGGKSGGPGGQSAAPLQRPMVFPAAPPADAGPGFNATNDGKSWPKACEMLSDAQIGKVIKGATVKTRKPDTTVSVKYDFPGAADNQCDFDLAVPDPNNPKYPSYAKIELTLHEVSTPATAKGHYGDTKKNRARKPFGEFEELGTKLGTDDAFRDDSYIYFYKGPYFVELYVHSGLTGPGGAKLADDDGVKQYGPTLIGYLVARM
ncbi:hypothetical protein [Embleya sp. MST-111070]|uniref:hypothetical protein n=1 Tax=Embleya sp. MST-111070 TaxID=3398231 RepID=UPI003F73BEB6